MKYILYALRVCILNVFRGFRLAVKACRLVLQAMDFPIAFATSVLSGGMLFVFATAALNQIWHDFLFSALMALALTVSFCVANIAFALILIWEYCPAKPPKE